MYTQRKFGIELKEKIAKAELVSDIAGWCHNLYYDYISDVIDTDFGELLLQLGTMEMGSEFERSYEELDQIADRLIAGEDVKL